MAKKKIELRTSGSSVESGDVNITYNNVRIAGLSESTSAVLETEDTVCKHDIEIEYTKPENEPVEITVPVYEHLDESETYTLIGSATTIPGVYVSVAATGHGIATHVLDTMYFYNSNNSEMSAVQWKYEYSLGDGRNPELIFVQPYMNATYAEDYNSLVIVYLDETK